MRALRSCGCPAVPVLGRFEPFAGVGRQRPLRRRRGRTSLWPGVAVTGGCVRSVLWARWWTWLRWWACESRSAAQVFLDRCWARGVGYPVYLPLLGAVLLRFRAGRLAVVAFGGGGVGWFRSVGCWGGLGDVVPVARLRVMFGYPGLPLTVLVALRAVPGLPPAVGCAVFGFRRGRPAVVAFFGCASWGCTSLPRHTLSVRLTQAVPMRGVQTVCGMANGGVVGGCGAGGAGFDAPRCSCRTGWWPNRR